MTVLDFLTRAKNELHELYGSAEANALVNHLLQERLSWSFSELRNGGDMLIPDELSAQLDSDLERLKNGEPVQYILGYAWFNEIKIGVDKNVLIPRPETEELLSFIQDNRFMPGATFLDIGTGSGCIALALKQTFPDARVFAADVSESALQIAQRNSASLHLPLEFVIWDVLTDAKPPVAIPPLDLIVSNPPYICMNEFPSLHLNVTEYEPHLALFVPDDEPLLFYKMIAGYAKNQLKEGGRLWFEINREYGEEVAEMLEKMSFEDVRIYRDLAGSDRFVYAVKNA